MDMVYHKALINSMYKDFQSVLDNDVYQGLTLAEVMGTLDVIKLNLWARMRSDDDEE